jgi:translation initiation factor 5A
MKREQAQDSSSSEEEQDYQDQFEESSSGASMSVPRQANTLKKGMYVVLNGRPCKIVEITFSKNGKHGHSKANYIAADIFNGKRYDDVCPSSRIVFCPVVTLTQYTLMDISEDKYMQLMSDDHEMKEDLVLPAGEDGEKMQKLFDKGEETIVVTVVNAMGMEDVVSVKEQ